MRELSIKGGVNAKVGEESLKACDSDGFFTGSDWSALAEQVAVIGWRVGGMSSTTYSAS